MSRKRIRNPISRKAKGGRKRQPVLKKPEVIPITKPVQVNANSPRLIVSDLGSQRAIFCIGSERYAYDYSSKITKLSPEVGDHPAPIIPLPEAAVEERRSKRLK